MVIASGVVLVHAEVVGGVPIPFRIVEDHVVSEIVLINGLRVLNRCSCHSKVSRMLGTTIVPDNKKGIS